MNGRTNSPGNTIDELQVPLDPPSDLNVVSGNAYVTLTWNDPVDKYATPEGETAQDPQQLVSQFAYTRIIRKVGSQPTNPHDGDLVTESAVRDQYQVSGYTDNGVANDVTYYYALYACNTDGVYSDGLYSDPVTPKAFREVLAENSWAEISDACAKGIAASLWSVGDEKPLSVNGQVLRACIIGFNADTLADGSGTAVLTFTNIELPDEIRAVHSSTGIKFWDQSDRCTWYNNDLIATMDSDLQAVLQPVTKISHYNNDCDSHEYNSATCKVFDFLARELSSGHNLPYDGEQGEVYEYYTTTANRIKYGIGGKTIATDCKSTHRDGTNAYSTRDIYVSDGKYGYQYLAYQVLLTGSINHGMGDNGYGAGPVYWYLTNRHCMSFGFCIGKYSG